jgi:uncharacterized protein (DUF4415 family)
MSTKHPPNAPHDTPFDDDNPEWTEEDFANARPASEVLPPSLYHALTKPRGRPKLMSAKVAVKLRLDPDVLDGFKAGGPGWQTRINAALKEALGRRER